ncbi:MAG: STAS domain-containing protein [Rhodospirillaceae bacterium]
MIHLPTLEVLWRLATRRGLQATRDQALELLIVAMVTLLTVFSSVIVAAVTGLVATSPMFAALIGRSIIREKETGANARSRTTQPHNELEFLDSHPGLIALIKVQGSIFFGSADRLARVVGEASRTAGFIVLDLKLVAEVDTTGLKIMAQLERRIKRDGKMLLYAFFSEEHILYYTIINLDQDWPGLHERNFGVWIWR